jgi:CheY-like chemotaxis protein
VLYEDTHILPMAGPLVLVADDEARPRDAVTRMLEGLGHQARSCSSGRAALRFLGAHPGEVRLLLADLGMPGMDGGELAERSRDLDPSLAVVLMAGAGDVEAAEARELLSGYHDLPLLWKPVGLGDLTRTIEGLIVVSGRSLGYPLSASPRHRTRRRSDRHEV